MGSSPRAVSRWRRLVIDVRPLRQPAYRRLFGSTVVTSVGSQLTAVAVPVQLFNDSGSSAMVGLSGAVAFVPLVVFALLGGSIADAFDRRRVLLVTNAGIALTSAGLWLQALSSARSVWVVLALLAAQQACFGLNSPARGAAIPRLVSSAELPAAQALNSTVFVLGAVVGPLAAGALIPVAGLSTLYLIDTLALGVALWAVWRLPAMAPSPTRDGRRRPIGAGSMFEGLRYIRLQTLLLVSFVVDIIAMVLGMPRALFPEMAELTFGGGLALGVLYAAIPAGALLAGMVSGAFSRIRRHGAAVVVAVIVWGLAVVGFGLSDSLWVGAAFLALGGAADLVSMVFRGSILLSATTEELRGRIQGVFVVVVVGGPRLADVLHGTVGELVGTRAAVTGGGLLVVVAAVALAIALPAFWRYRVPADD